MYSSVQLKLGLIFFFIISMEIGAMSTSLACRLLPDRHLAETLFTDMLSRLVCVCTLSVCSYTYLCIGVGVYLRTWAFLCGCEYIWLLWVYIYTTSCSGTFAPVCSICACAIIVGVTIQSNSQRYSSNNIKLYMNVWCCTYAIGVHTNACMLRRYLNFNRNAKAMIILLDI